MEGHNETPEILLKQLNPDVGDVKRRIAVAKITELARNANGRRSIVNAGGIARLVKLISQRNSVLRVGAAHALCNLANDRENHNEIVKHGAIKAFVQLLHDGTRDGVVAGAVNLANLTRNPHFVKLVLSEVGGPKVLLMMLRTWDHCSARDVCADLLVRLSANKSSEPQFLSDEAMDAMIALYLDNAISIETREKVLTAIYNVVVNRPDRLECVHFTK